MPRVILCLSCPMNATPISPEEVLAKFTLSATEFITTARAIPAQDLHKNPIIGQWSPAFVLHHMCDGDLHFTTRFLNCLAEDNPAIFPFEEEIYPLRLNYEKRDPMASLASIEGNFVAAKNILSRISESDWQRTSVHTERGEIRLLELVSISAGHSEAHRGQLEEIVAAL